MSNSNDTSSRPPKGGYPIECSYSWLFPSDLLDEVADYACRFDRPFWATFQINGDTRSVKLPDGTLITEKLEEVDDHYYLYGSNGVPGISGYQGFFMVVETDDPKLVLLTWTFSFLADTMDHLSNMLAINARAVPVMSDRLKGRFGVVILEE